MKTRRRMYRTAFLSRARIYIISCFQVRKATTPSSSTTASSGCSSMTTTSPPWSEPRFLVYKQLERHTLDCGRTRGLSRLSECLSVSLRDMLKYTASVREWMSADPRNIIAIHCKGGKGGVTVPPSLTGLSVSGEDVRLMSPLLFRRTHRHYGLHLAHRQRPVWERTGTRPF